VVGGPGWTAPIHGSSGDVLKAPNGLYAVLSRDRGIPDDASIERWSKDGRSLVVPRTDCAMDCPEEESVEYMRIDLK
jgi:hypothetical protein